MNRSKPIVGTLLLTMIITVAFSQTKKPNILVIMGDDIGQSCVSVYSPGS